MDLSRAVLRFCHAIKRGHRFFFFSFSRDSQPSISAPFLLYPIKIKLELLFGISFRDPFSGFFSQCLVSNKSSMPLSFFSALLNNSSATRNRRFPFSFSFFFFELLRISFLDFRFVSFNVSEIFQVFFPVIFLVSSLRLQLSYLKVFEVLWGFWRFAEILYLEPFPLSPSLSDSFPFIFISFSIFGFLFDAFANFHCHSFIGFSFWWESFPFIASLLSVLFDFFIIFPVSMRFILKVLPSVLRLHLWVIYKQIVEFLCRFIRSKLNLRSKILSRQMASLTGKNSPQTSPRFELVDRADPPELVPYQVLSGMNRQKWNWNLGCMNNVVLYPRGTQTRNENQNKDEGRGRRGRGERRGSTNKRPKIKNPPPNSLSPPPNLPPPPPNIKPSQIESASNRARPRPRQAVAGGRRPVVAIKASTAAAAVAVAAASSAVFSGAAGSR